MGKAKIVEISGFLLGNDVLSLLIKKGIVVGVKTEKGWLIARYGVNKGTLKKELKKNEG